MSLTLSDRVLVAQRHSEEAQRRILSSVSVDPESGCWVWQKYLDNAGYGRLSFRCETGLLAHRFSYTAFVGVAGDTLDHLCRNRACCNPDHLECVSQAENLRRAYVAPTACPKGHVYDKANSYRSPAGRLRCRICMRARQAHVRAARPEHYRELHRLQQIAYRARKRAT